MSKLLIPPLLYLITDRQQFAPSQSQIKLQLDLIAQAAQTTRPNQLLIQIRERGLAAQTLCEFVRAAITVARPHGARVLVNDRLDVALAAGADGVHLRVNSLPGVIVRRIRPDNFLMGVSTHSLAEAQAAEAQGADFIVCGPVFPTPSKMMYGPPLGLNRFAEICRTVSLPVLALGGITRDNYSTAYEHGAAGIAAIRLFNNRQTLGSDIKMMLSSPRTPQD